MPSPLTDQFEDIRIIDLDTNRTYNPDPVKKLYNVYLKLSAPPPADWAQIFDSERQFPRHSMWRHAWVEGLYIVVHAPLEEIEKCHLPDLREDVQKTNSKYRAYLTQKAAAEVEEGAFRGREREEIDELRKKLGFGEEGDGESSE